MYNYVCDKVLRVPHRGRQVDHAEDCVLVASEIINMLGNNYSMLYYSIV